ncbi:LysM repeat protein [Pseudarthrobacter oxydans]|uniref:LysM peptidoglycan-binding domain-containing protein n=1 Tax=Pseudarthrobacter oxydans TaxID=1671 RepID=UPI0027809E68|nr:LysM peptidoglycan-binding domain-containing protein [Pseudarthrobacter oxydans]MDP9982262.1 LysM repeat protein [Pseudarthrobacter oxydans]
MVAGDTVGAIASRFGVNVYDMLEANGLGAYTLIHPGQTLKLSGPPVPGPALAPAPARAAPALTAPAVPVVRTIFVAGSGGQAMVDRCIGPIHFTPTDAYSLFITEHDFCGGWARFSGIGVGETVVIAGYGTYTATARGQVSQGGTTNNVAAVFGGFPRAILQTCIPGTNQMLLIGLN